MGTQQQYNSEGLTRVDSQTLSFELLTKLPGVSLVTFSDI